MRTNLLRIFATLGFLVLFNFLFFFLGGTDQSAVNWVSYGFIHVAYLMILATPLFQPKGGELTVLTTTLYLQSIVYFIAQLAVGVAFIYVQPQSVRWPLIVQSIGFTLFLIWQLLSVMANDATEASVQKQRTESARIRELTVQVRDAMRNVENEELRKSVARCFDVLNSSSIESFPEAEDAELKLCNAVEMLCAAIEDNDQAQIEAKAKRVYNAVLSRNDVIRRCRMKK